MGTYDCKSVQSFEDYVFKSDSKALGTMVLPKNPRDGKFILAADVVNSKQSTRHCSMCFYEST